MDKRTRWKVAGLQAQALLALVLLRSLPLFRLVKIRRK